MEEWIPLEQIDTAKGDERKNLLYSWTYTPSGRYAVDFDYKEIPQLEDEPDTHHFLFRFFVLDILEKTWCPYIGNTGPFKRFYSFYWLSDEFGVLLDFSKREGSVRQNLLYYEHDKKVVSCTVIRNIEFDVDYMCYSRDFTAQKFVIPEGEFVVLCGYRSSEDGMLCRLIPYYLYGDTPFDIKEFIIDTRRLVLCLTGDAQLRTGGHPFTFGSSLTFLLYKDNPDNEVYITPRHARMRIFTLPQHPGFVPWFKSIPNLFNSGNFVLLWEQPKRNYSRRRKGKTKVFLLDLQTINMHVIHTSLLKNDFVCIHPSGAVHTYIQTADGMKMKTSNMSFSTKSLEKICQQKLIQVTCKATPTLLELSKVVFSIIPYSYY
uniref:DUF295 domain-containing protein n=1 Tax=Haemonchus contortus TaxID=6289 RepID=A0A7I4YLR0_HAECO